MTPLETKARDEILANVDKIDWQRQGVRWWTATWRGVFIAINNGLFVNNRNVDANYAADDIADAIVVTENEHYRKALRALAGGTE